MRLLTGLLLFFTGVACAPAARPAPPAEFVPPPPDAPTLYERCYRPSRN